MTIAVAAQQTWRSTIKSAKHACKEVCEHASPSPQGKFFIQSDLLRSSLVPFWGDIAKSWTTYCQIQSLCYKRLQNQRHGFASLLRGYKAAVRCGERRELQFSRVRYYYCEASMWLLCISSVGHSVRSYVCADLLSIREGMQPFKRWVPCLSKETSTSREELDMSGLMIEQQGMPLLALHLCISLDYISAYRTHMQCQVREIPSGAAACM